MKHIIWYIKVFSKINFVFLVGTLTCSGDGCDNLNDDDLATSWANGNSLQVDFDCINFHEIVWWATDYPNQEAYRNVCLWVDDVEVTISE